MSDFNLSGSSSSESSDFDLGGSSNDLGDFEISAEETSSDVSSGETIEPTSDATLPNGEELGVDLTQNI